jgi:hypothetical protein
LSLPNPNDRSTLTPPEPPRDWTETHDPNPVRGTVTERTDYQSRDGDPFTVIVVTDEDGNDHRIPLSRSDLRPLVEKEDVTEDDDLAIQFWGMQGPRFVYTYAIDKARAAER